MTGWKSSSSEVGLSLGSLFRHLRIKSRWNSLSRLSMAAWMCSSVMAPEEVGGFSGTGGFSDGLESVAGVAWDFDPSEDVDPGPLPPPAEDERMSKQAVSRAAIPNE